ncbi:MAG: hypothetical protein JO301_18290 [Chitinophagaceae bacterium]|nr:hypothetical protein [Chitinophagaceae bacterium]
MRILLGLVIPVLLLLLPLAYQVTFTRRRLRHKTDQSILVTFIYSMFSEGLVSIAASYIAMFGLEWGSVEVKCLTGVFAYVFFGLVIAFTLMPVIALAGWLLQWHLRSKNA